MEHESNSLEYTLHSFYVQYLSQFFSDKFCACTSLSYENAYKHKKVIFLDVHQNKFVEAIKNLSHNQQVPCTSQYCN